MHTQVEPYERKVPRKRPHSVQGAMGELQDSSKRGVNERTCMPSAEPSNESVQQHRLPLEDTHCHKWKHRDVLERKEELVDD